MYYTDEAIYIESQTTLLGKINAIESCITALLSTALKAAGTADMQEYMLNDGQTIIKKAYRNPNAVYSAVDVLEKMKARYINKYNGRQSRLIPANNLYTNRTLP